MYIKINININVYICIYIHVSFNIIKHNFWKPSDLPLPKHLFQDQINQVLLMKQPVAPRFCFFNSNSEISLSVCRKASSKAFDNTTHGPLKQHINIM